MLGQLPKALTVKGKSYAIRSDYRNILRIFEAFADPDLTDNDKLFICLKRIYVDFAKIPKSDLKEAYDVLQLGDFEQAKPGFEAYLEAEKDYVKNKFDYPLSLKNKIEEKLGFYFEHYGYIPGVLSGGNQD